MNEQFYFKGKWGFCVCGWSSGEIAQWLWDMKEKANSEFELMNLVLTNSPEKKRTVQTGFPQPIYLFIPRWTPKGRLKFSSDVMEWRDFLSHGVNKDLKFNYKF